jgi:uncharacterized protein YdcH (DUF465 family)
MTLAIKDHTILQDFPEMSEHIHEIKKTNSHFASLSDKYDELVHSINRMESGAETFADEQLEELKKKRLKLKDELFGLLKKAA